MARPKSVRGPLYDTVISRNMRAIVEHECEGSINAFAAKYRLNQPTINRICNGTSDTSTQQLELVAENLLSPLLMGQNRSF